MRFFEAGMLPRKKIQQQLKRDAAMRDAEDQLDKEKTGGRRKK